MIALCTRFLDLVLSSTTHGMSLKTEPTGPLTRALYENSIHVVRSFRHGEFIMSLYVKYYDQIASLKYICTHNYFIIAEFISKNIFLHFLKNQTMNR
jgi:hypothetical protein